MAFYKKFTPKKNPKISFSQNNERKFSNNRQGDSAQDTRPQQGEFLTSNSSKTGRSAQYGGYNSGERSGNHNQQRSENDGQGKGERSGYSRSFDARNNRSDYQQHGTTRYSPKNNFSQSDNRRTYARPSEARGATPAQNSGNYGRPADSRSNSTGEYHKTYGKPSENRSAGPNQNRGLYGRPADSRGNSTGEYRNTAGKPTENRSAYGRPAASYSETSGEYRKTFSKPVENRRPYGRPPENRGSSSGEYTNKYGKQTDGRSSAPTDNKGKFSQTQSVHAIPFQHSSDSQQFRQNVNDLAPNPYELPENLLSGRNPIREALKTGRDIEKLMVASGELSGSAREIIAMAKNAGIIIQTVERTRLDQITRNHQGMIAFASAFPYSSLEEIFEAAKQKEQSPFIVILDKITDPMNLGAIIRSAACAGAHGVIVQQHRAVGLTPSAVRASAGAIEHVKVARVTNINQTIRDIKKMGIWIYSADPKGEDYRKVDFSGACALVIGSEGEGVSQLTLELSDQTISIPMSGVIDSLNASVAAGILMYAVYTGREKTL